MSQKIKWLKRKTGLLWVCLTTIPSLLFGNPRQVSELPVPAGYERCLYPAAEYSGWLQTLPLKHDKKIRKFDGSFITHDYYQILAVIDMPLLFARDLEQCADFCMRFRAEYLRSREKLDSLYLFDYPGNKKYFNESGKTFQQFLLWAMAYSNSYSLKQGCIPVTQDQLQPGDMIIQNDTGSIGHVSLITDHCVNQQKQSLYLIGFSFMPAQEFHIEQAPAGYGQAGWFSLAGYLLFLEKYYNYGNPCFRRFE